jgi:hypothetical protein
MLPTSHPGHIIAQDTGEDDSVEETLTDLPISQSEIDELLYGDDRPAAERIARLRELAGDLRAFAAGEVDGEDVRTLIASIEEAIDTLETKARFVGEPGMLDEDPMDHRETLSPDSDEYEEIEQQDEQSVEDDIGTPVQGDDRRR